MKKLLVLFSLITAVTYGQLSIKTAKDSLQKYRMGSYSYHEAFIDHAGYGAPVILTKDGGAAGFGGWADEKGSCGLLVRLDNTGKEKWKKTVRFESPNSEAECQSVVEDKAGNFYVYILMYDSKAYRGGNERVVCFDKTGKMLWDKRLGKPTLLNNPTVSYIRTLDDGRVYMRGHIVTKQPVAGKDPEYQYWEGWINNLGKLTQKAGDVIVWANKEWEKKFKPE